MIQIGDVLPGVFPSTFTLEEMGAVPRKQLGRDRRIPVRAVVEWIHPAGRFVTIRFEFGGGASFRESKFFNDIKGGPPKRAAGRDGFSSCGAGA